jgi:5'-nucleotidase
MRLHHDVKLAQQVLGIDIILGGHDHDYIVESHNGISVVKAGTDFSQFSNITMYQNVSPEEAALQMKSLDEDKKEIVQYAYSERTKIFTEV